jgi:hypothetical protein
MAEQFFGGHQFDDAQARVGQDGTLVDDQPGYQDDAFADQNLDAGDDLNSDFDAGDSGGDMI